MAFIGLVAFIAFIAFIGFFTASIGLSFTCEDFTNSLLCPLTLAQVLVKDPQRVHH